MKTDRHNSVEHDNVHVVAVNDPFIEPEYAVRLSEPSFPGKHD
jgi:hypothetical protein